MLRRMTKRTLYACKPFLYFERALSSTTKNLNPDLGHHSSPAMSSSGRPQRNRHQSQGSEEASPIVQQTLPKAAKPPRPGPAATSSLVSKDHRHRPSGLWYPPSDVYRLSKVPKLFVQPLVVPTTSTEDLRVAHRARKAWMYCVSTGPCWELLEDRAFFKEEYVSYNASLGQGRRIRPQVYPGISSSEYFKYISPT